MSDPTVSPEVLNVVMQFRDACMWVADWQRSPCSSEDEAIRVMQFWRDRLLSTLASMEADKRRLDWLESKGQTLWASQGAPTTEVWSVMGSATASLREAIDAASKETDTPWAAHDALYASRISFLWLTCSGSDGSGTLRPYVKHRRSWPQAPRSRSRPSASYASPRSTPVSTGR